MEPSIFGFIWKYSKRQQLVILALSVLLLPLNYYSYELPKQIVNRALGSDEAPSSSATHGPAGAAHGVCAACSSRSCWSAAP